MEKFYFGPDLIAYRMRGIQEALERSHATKEDLYEEDEDGPNLLYSNSWDTITRRNTWRALRSAFGLSHMIRSALPDELKDGTIGPDFEVR